MSRSLNNSSAILAWCAIQEQEISQIVRDLNDCRHLLQKFTQQLERLKEFREEYLNRGSESRSLQANLDCRLFLSRLELNIDGLNSNIMQLKRQEDELVLHLKNSTGKAGLVDKLVEKNNRENTNRLQILESAESDEQSLVVYNSFRENKPLK